MHCSDGHFQNLQVCSSGVLKGKTSVMFKLILKVYRQPNINITSVHLKKKIIKDNQNVVLQTFPYQYCTLLFVSSWDFGGFVFLFFPLQGPVRLSDLNFWKLYSLLSCLDL